MVAMTLLWATVMGLMVACGEDGDNDDTLLTGLSGVVILVLVVWVVWKLAHRNKG